MEPLVENGYTQVCCLERQVIELSLQCYESHRVLAPQVARATARQQRLHFGVDCLDRSVISCVGRLLSRIRRNGGDWIDQPSGQLLHELFFRYAVTQSASRIVT